jgi:hypothetical protein
MNVIRDSPQTILNRELLDKQKREILNGNFSVKRKSSSFISNRSMDAEKGGNGSRMNQFMQERMSQVSTQDQYAQKD